MTIVVTVFVQVEIWLCSGLVSVDLKDPFPLFWKRFTAGLRGLFYLLFRPEAAIGGGEAILTAARRGGEHALMPAKIFTRRIDVMVSSI